MKEVYKSKVLAEGFTIIDEIGRTNMILIEGDDRALLVDSGFGFGDLPGYLKKLTDKPITLVNTHGHVDHAGGNHFFEKAYYNYNDLSCYISYQRTEKVLIINKFINDCKAAGKELPWDESFDIEAYGKTHNNMFVPLTDGMEFDLGGRVVETIFMPGHTKGSVMFLDKKTGILMAGDNIGPSVWIMFPDSERLYSYREHLVELKKDTRIKAVYYSHMSELISTSIIDSLINAIPKINNENSKLFIHPRNGRKALKYKEELQGIPGNKYLYIVYQPYNL